MTLNTGLVPMIYFDQKVESTFVSQKNSTE